MKKVAAYCRVSTDKDIQQSSLELQMESYRDIISSHEDWELAEIYADEGKSGTATKSRKEFNRMIIDAQNGKIDYILAKSISRFARNTVDTLEYTRKLRDLGVGVFFEEQGLDTLSVTSEIFLTIHAAFAQEESHSISENMKHGLRNRVAMGIPKWSKTYGYRSENGKFIIDLAQASVVRYIFCSAANGMSLTEIVSSLKEQGIKSPSGKKEWFTHTVSMILRNERYIGDVQTQKTVTVDFLTHKRKINDGQVPNPYLSDDHEAIIDRETFERAGRASQKGYIQYTIQIIALVLNTIVCAFLIKTGYSIQIVKLTTSFIFLLKPLLLTWYVKKHYNIDTKITYNEEPIKQKWNGMAQHFASYVLGGTDNIVLTLFSTLAN